MNTEFKTAAPHSEAARTTQLYRVAVVGAGSLKGKEIAEVLSQRNFPSVDVKLLDDDESLGQLEAVGEEVTFIRKVRADEFRKVDFTFFAGDVASTEKSWKIAQQAGSAIVDLTFALENDPAAHVRSPWMERLLGCAPAVELQPGPAVIAHPAAVVLAFLLQRLRRAGEIRHANAVVFEPASEHGQKGMDELHEQTVNLLSFQPLPKNVFDTQVAFNMLSRYGEQAAPALATVETRILKHYRAIAEKNLPVPSILLLQAPIFHGHAFTIHADLGERVDVEAISQAMAGERIQLTSGAEDSPSNVNAAGQDDIQLSILPDGSNPNGVWLWAASDNLRVAATTAVECAETMAASRPRGQIQ
jgi:aspartate-semialdehyde dehydrogenase